MNHTVRIVRASYCGENVLKRNKTLEECLMAYRMSPWFEKIIYDVIMMVLSIN